MALCCSLSTQSTSVMKRQVKEKVAHVVTQNRTSVMSEESGQSFVEDHRFGESAPVGLTLGSVSVPFL